MLHRLLRGSGFATRLASQAPSLDWAAGGRLFLWVRACGKMLGRPHPSARTRLFSARRRNLLMQGNRELRRQQQWHSTKCSHRRSFCLNRQRFLPEP